MSFIIAEQAKLDLELVPKEKKLEIRKCNERLKPGKIQREHAFLVFLDAPLTPCYSAFLITEDVLKKSLEISSRFSLEYMFRTLMHFLLMKNVSFLRELRHTGEINSLNNAVVDHMHQPWRTFAALINKSLSGKTTVSTKEPMIKSKRVKRHAKKSTKGPSRGVAIRETPQMPLTKKKEKVDVTQESDHKENEEDEDDEEEMKDEFLYDDLDIRLNESVDTDKGFVQEEGTNVAMTNIQQGNKNPEILRVIEDAHMTFYTFTQKTEVLVTSSSYSSDLATKFLNFLDIPHTDAKIVSPMDVHVYHEVPSQQTPTLFTVPVLIISDSSPVFSTVIPQSLPSFTPPPQQSTSIPPPTTKATNPPSTLLDFASVFQFNNRVTTLEKEVSELKKDPLHTQVTSLVDDHLDVLGATRDEFMNFLLTSLTARIRKQVNNQLPQILLKEVSNFAPRVIQKMVKESLENVVLDTEIRKSYDLDKTIFSTYGKVYSLKRSQKDKDKDPSAGSDRGLKKRKTRKDAEPTKGPKAKESQSGSSKGDKSQSKSFGKSVRSEELEFKVVDSDMPQDHEENPGNDDEEPKEKLASIVEFALFSCWFHELFLVLKILPMMDIGTSCREIISFVYNLVRVSILYVARVGMKCTNLNHAIAPDSIASGLLMNLELKLVVGKVSIAEQKLVLNRCLDWNDTTANDEIQVSAVGLTYYASHGVESFTCCLHWPPSSQQKGFCCNGFVQQAWCSIEHQEVSFVDVIETGKRKFMQGSTLNCWVLAFKISTSRRMAPKRTSTSAAPAMTQAAIWQLVADSVVAALEAQVANMANTNNTNRSSDQEKLLFNCSEDCKVKFATGTLTEDALWWVARGGEWHRGSNRSGDKERFWGSPEKFFGGGGGGRRLAGGGEEMCTLANDALSWWNAYAQPIGIEQANRITWTELKRLLTNKYCSQIEIKKMEDEFYNLSVKGNDLKTYVRRFQELVGLCPNMRCTLHHTGPCTIRCRFCNKIGRLTKNCKNKGPATGSNLQPVSIICHACGEKGHYQSQCSKTNINTNERTYLLRDKNAHQDPNVVTGSDNESDDASVHNEATNTQQQPNIQPQIITTVSNNNAKFPYLKKDEYEVWDMKMEYWITNNDMNIWKVIQNGNSLKRIKRDHDEGSIPDDHVADFHYMDNARDIWNAVKARFGGNVESKKMRESMLKQEFSEFRIGDAGEFALMGVTFEVHNYPFGCDNKYNELNKQYNELNEQNGKYFIQVQAYKNSLKTFEKQKKVLQRNHLTLEDKIRVLSLELENTSNLLKHSKRINANVEIAKKDLQT
nr:reverse transcriptase domain-containing protein [Tanacetum cinerariifolium]